jgi:hypothetical protein
MKDLEGTTYINDKYCEKLISAIAVVRNKNKIKYPRDSIYVSNSDGAADI